MLVKILFIALITLYQSADTNWKKINKISSAKLPQLSKISKDVVKNLKNTVYNEAGYAIIAAAFYGINKYLIKRNDKEFQENWDKEMNTFTEKEIDILKKKFNEFSKKCEDLDKKIYGKELGELNSFFEKEKKAIVSDYIIDFLSSNIIEKNIKNINYLNILCLGKTQIGKTTLINEILFLDDDKKGLTGGKAKSTTMKDTSYTSDKLKHIRITDTRGIEIGNFSLKNFTEHYLNKMKENTKYGNYNELIHCIWYCISGNVLSDEEMNAIQKINSLFNEYKVPIIFVYLRPSNYKDIILLQKETSKINDNFIAVQSIDYVEKCNKKDPNCFNERNEIKKKNMNVLLEMTRKLAFEGIKNSVSSRTSFYLIEKIEKMFDERFGQKSEEFVNLLKEVEVYLQNGKSTIISKDIDDAREKNILKIIEIIEETLYYSKKEKEELPKECKDIIYSIQNKIENLYYQNFDNFYKEYLNNLFKKIKEKKIISHEYYRENTLFGCNDLDESKFNDDFQKTEEKFESNNIVQLYSMIASFEAINKKLKNNILSLLKSGIDKILANDYLLDSLEEKIKQEANIWTKDLINSLDKEIKAAFKK